MSNRLLSEMECPVCTLPFDLDQHVPIVGTCGHTVCLSCAQHSYEYNGYGHLRCPTCRTANAFAKLSHNFFMTEVLREMRTAAHEREIEEKKLAALPKCHICSTKMEEKRARFCRPCCLEKNYISVNPDDSVTIKDMEKVEPFVMCAACFLEGAHEGHKSQLLLPVKLHFSAVTEYKKLRGEIQTISTTSFDRGVAELKEIVQSCDKPLKRLNEHGHMVGTTEKFEEILAKCQKQKMELDEVKDQFDRQVKDHADRLKKIYEELNQAAYDASIVIPATLVGYVAEVCPPGATLGIALVNNSNNRIVRFFVGKKPANCNVVVPSNTLRPGSTVVLSVLQGGRKTGKNRDITINYCLVNGPDEKTVIDEMIVVPFKY